MEAFNNFVSTINGFVWGPVMLVLLFGTHVYLTLRTGVIQRKTFTGVKLSITPDKEASGDARFNMGNSLMVGCAKMGLNFTACAPKAYFPAPELVQTCQKLAVESGGSVRLMEDPMEATKGADVIYTDIWVSMGEPVEVWAERIRDLSPYQVNKALMDNAGLQCRFMHCLPAYHDHRTKVGKEMGEKFGRDAMEVTDEVFESPQSIVFDEAENRMHTIKAVMAATLGYTGD